MFKNARPYALPRCTPASLLAIMLAMGLSMVTVPTEADDLPTVRWLLLDFPPYHIANGPNQDKGLRDHFLAALLPRLPQFTHVKELSATERQTMLMKAGAPVCSLSMLKTPEREEFMLFSKQPFARQLPIRLLAMGAVADEIKKAPPQGDEVNLERLLALGRFHIGVIPKRRFGAAIDDVLARTRLSHRGVVMDFAEQGLLAGLLKLMTKNRFEVTLGYTVEVEQLKQENAQLAAVAYFPIEEAHELVPTYVSCSKGVLGEKLIAAIDELDPNDPSVARLAHDYAALLPNDEKARYRALLGFSKY